jgi:hypothetical protein
VYTSDGTTLTRLRSTGSTVAAGASAIQQITVASTTVPIGWNVYLALAPDNATITIGRTSITSALTAPGKRVLAFTGNFPLPATLTISSGVATGNAPYVIAEP